jgi:pSer/pThr/pTyr-binding forkhead associated (FHA) protein/PBP1b-binding outer membrane lipoprotein LpoB
MDKMHRLILKIILILVCVNSNAEPESIEPAIDVEIESIESLAIEAVDDVLFEETDAIIDAAIEDEPFLADQFQAGDETVLIKDVVLVLDNSGSMKKNDPDFLVSKAVKEFISQQDENTRVGIVIFDQGVRLPVALTTSSLANREIILNSIEEINYKGLFTDSPAGIERAIYELKNNGRDDAEKSIIFMTDGIVDTGAADRDLEKSKWLREDLAPDAADNEIKIFGIAFTEGADFQLIQSIAQKTEGEYYRALTAGDLQNVFEQINTIINTPPEPEPIPEVVQPPVVETPAPVVQAPPPPPVIIEVPAQTMGKEERIRSIIMIAAAIVLTITLLGILILLLRRNRDLKAGANESVQEAYINDLQGKTDKPTHKLGTKPVMFGRVAGKDTDHLDYIVVNETTIGRRHALIEYKDYSFWIIDQGSINGTFVNGEAVSSEVRLKHGDRLRLHKCDFEFIMPEMEDSGMTVISSTVFAEQPEAGMDDSEEATQIRDHDAPGGLSAEELNTASSSDMDFDLTGTDSADDLSDLYEPDPDEEETIIREVPSEKQSASEPEFTLDEDEFDSEDETIMLDDGETDEVDAEIDDDATLRKDDN